jgi:hypothetical protein
VFEKAPIEKLKSILNDDLSETYDQQDGDIDPSYFIYLANCEFEALDQKFKILPGVTFFTDVNKIILDTLRQNSKLLDFYNTTALKLFDFCQKTNHIREYRRVSETLHNHFF